MSTAPREPLPARVRGAPPRGGDLDARILQVEQRLMAREAGLRRQVAGLGTRVRQAVQPRRLLAPLAGGLLALGGLRWLWRRHGDAPGRASPAHVDGRAPAREGVSWTRLVPWTQLSGLVFPVLPAAWRARIDPGTFNTVISVGLPLVERLFVRPSMPPPQTAGSVASARLSGTWYEIARMPGLARAEGDGQPQVQHVLRGDGGIDLERRHLTGDGGEVVLRGEALPVRGSGGSRLRVSGWSAGTCRLPPSWHEEWVLHIDNATGELLLGSPGRDVLRLLSRRPRLAATQVHTLVEIARDQGYAVEQLQFVDRPCRGLDVR